MNVGEKGDRWSSQLISKGAFRYLKAANKLCENPLTADHPFWFCVCQSIELSLKSYLRAKGFTKEKLKAWDVGHNLEELLRLARQSNFDEVMVLTTLEQAIVSDCGKMYASKAFQYSEAGWSSLPFSKDALAVAERIASLTRPVAEAGRTFHHGKNSAVI
jgi:hypothetical protein